MGGTSAAEGPGGQEVHTPPFQEVAAITSDITAHTGGDKPVFVHSCDHEYTLTKTNGDQLILDNGLKDVEHEALAIKRKVFKRLRPPAVQRYQSGEALTFGPVSVQRRGGLHLNGKRNAWEAIQDIRADSGRFKVMLRDGKKGQTGRPARVSAILNVELLGQMVGVN